MPGDGLDHLFINHPTFCMLLLEPRIGKLNRNGLEGTGRKAFDQSVEPEHRVTECVMHIRKAVIVCNLVCFNDERLAYLDAQVIPFRAGGSHSKQEPSSCTADIE